MTGFGPPGSGRASNLPRLQPVGEMRGIELVAGADPDGGDAALGDPPAEGLAADAED